MYNNTYKVEKNQELVSGHFLLGIKAPEIVSTAKPGQFLHIKCNDLMEPILRRPLSIHCMDRAENIVYVFYRVVGRGTSLLAKIKPGESLDVLGPLGRGFTLPCKGERVAVLGGGMGTAPLVFLLEEIREIYQEEINKVSVFLGAVHKDYLVAENKIIDMGFAVYSATDDGSGSIKGTVLDLYQQRIKSSPHRIYACGPQPMLKGLSYIADPGVDVEISVEEYMGCGLGACLSCACEMTDSTGKAVSAHVCVDGPVFNLKEIILK